MERGSDVVRSERSVVQNGKTIVGVDITEYRRDGSSDTTHERAELFFGSVKAGAITGVTHNNPDGTSTYKKS